MREPCVPAFAVTITILDTPPITHALPECCAISLTMYFIPDRAEDAWATEVSLTGEGVLSMETMNLLDITIKYFNVIVFVLCVLFGMTSLFASWIAWREIHRKKNIIRSVVAAYNIAEDTLEKGRTPIGDFDMDPAIIQTVFNSLQEILNAIYGEVTGKPIPPREERQHGAGKLAAVRNMVRVLKRHPAADRVNLEHEVPTLLPDERERHHGVSAP